MIPKPFQQTGAPERSPIDVTTIDLGGDVVLVVDRDGRIVDVNDAFETATGFSREMAIGQTPRLLSSGLQPAEIYQELWETVLAGHVWTGQLVDRHRNGRLRTYRVTISPISGSDGRIQQLVAVQRDLASQRGRASIASGIGELHTDRAGRCTFLDAEAARLLGDEPDRLYADGWEARLPADDVAVIQDSIEAMLETGRTMRVDVRTIADRWLHLEISSLHHERTGIIGSSWYLEDITHEMLSHARLARRDAMVNALLEASEDPLAIVQADGIVQVVNAAWSRGQGDDHPLLDLGPGDHILDRLREHLPATDRAMGDVPGESRRDLDDGTEVPHAELHAALHGHLQGLSPEENPPGLRVVPLANEHGGLVIALSSRDLPDR